MIEPLINHLWQSTVCVLAAALLTLAFRKNGAKVRFLIWLAASVKFLIPFSLFIWVGEFFRWETTSGLPINSGFSIFGQFAQPGSFAAGNLAATLTESTLFPWGWSVWTIVLSIWLFGSVALLNLRLFQWLWLSAIVKTSSPLDIDASIPVRETTSTHEPGIFGIFSPTLLLPQGIASHVAPAHLDAILAHELCHWRRRDNLTAALHMLVEVLFWFHPLVWWLGGRLVVERERACDESVVESGRDREIYAEGILKVCQRYVELPACAAGVSGGLLRKRIEDIMTNPIHSTLPIAKRCLLSLTALLAIAAPIALGAIGGAGVAATEKNSVELRHYRNDEWKFEMNIPQAWVVEPPVPSNGPEVIRFHSPEHGVEGLVIWRSTNYPKHTSKSLSLATQPVLAGGGFSNFVSGETTIGSRQVHTLDFEQKLPDGSLMSCRHYFVVDGGVRYVLGFGTTNRDAMFPTFDRVAKSFVFENL